MIKQYEEMNEQEKLEWTFREKIVKQKRQPNTTVEAYGKDTGGKSVVGNKGLDGFTYDAVQDIDWALPENQFKYEWNKHGYRGPDENNGADIIFAGSSLTIGTGVPYEKSYPHLVSEELNLKHINISDFDTLTDLADSLFDFQHLDPSFVILNDCWAINSVNWLMRFWLKKERNNDTRKMIKDIFYDSNNKVIKLFDLAIKQAFPNAKCFILEPEEKRKFWAYEYELQNIKSVTYAKTDIVDLGRDQTHPGPRTHKVFADKIKRLIKDNG
jgi:hypothetical protein